MLLNLITDRTAEDVTRWLALKAKGYANMTEAERAEWANSKGAYNYTDLNRVESAVEYLAALLTGYGYYVKLGGVRSWAEEDVPTLADATRFLGNVKAIRTALAAFQSTPKVPASMHNLTYEAANAIEQILADVETLANNMASIYAYGGEIYGGEIW